MPRSKKSKSGHAVSVSSIKSNSSLAVELSPVQLEIQIGIYLEESPRTLQQILDRFTLDHRAPFWFMRTLSALQTGYQCGSIVQLASAKLAWFSSNEAVAEQCGRKN